MACTKTGMKMKRAIKTFVMASALLGSFWIAIPAAQSACTGGACIAAGPRLASIDSTRGVLLNALLGNLLGSSVSLTVADWNAVAAGNINLVDYLNALQADLGVSDTTTALSTSASLLQLITAMIEVAQADGNIAVVNALNVLVVPIGGLPGTLRLGDLLSIGSPTGTFAEIELDVLDLVTGMIQLYNYNNVATTPSPITISGSALGLGSLVNGVQLYAQVIEPPVFRCGTTGSQFHTAAVRVKLDVDLVDLAVDASALNLLPGVSGAAVTLAQVEVYTEVARAEGTLTSIDALAGAVTIQATPGVADVYVGTISDSVFFNRSRVLNAATDLGYGTIGSIRVLLSTVAIQVRSSARGEAPFSETLNFSGPYPQTRTASTSAAFIANLADDLVTNLELQVTPGLGLLEAVVLPTLKTIVSGALTPVLTAVLTSVVDPLLELLGIRLGEVDVSVYGVAQACPVSGNVYEDVNHNSRRDTGESGSGLTLYAKLVSTASPGGPASQTVAADPGSGAYSFAAVLAGNYTLIIDSNNTLADIAADLPAGWIGTQPSALARSVSIATAQLSAQDFGLFQGSRVDGSVFADTGRNGGTANNGVKDGQEKGVAGVSLSVTDDSRSTTYDNTSTAADGSFTLWIPVAAGNNPLRIREKNPSGHISVGGNAGNTAGSYDRDDDETRFVHATGSLYNGVSFADVPENSLSTDGQQTAPPGSVVFYPHTFVAGSSGELAFATTGNATPAINGWSQVIYRDDNCNAVLDAGETIVVPTLSVSADDSICVLVKAFVPENAPFNARYQISLGASFTYTGATPALSANTTRIDLTTVATASDAGLKLVKSVDRSTALPGDTIVYTIGYTNITGDALSNLRIFDATPAYTVFGAAGCGALPADLIACNLSVAPTVGESGPLEWTLTGTLAPGASGTVSFSVVVE